MEQRHEFVLLANSGQFTVTELCEREQERRRRFGEKRTTGARRMRGADWGDLRVLRDLQKDLIGT